MAGEGMVAVMQGLRDCGLAVALLDEDGKTYTLVPKVLERKTTSTAALPSQCDAGAQATDGRYATVYKVHHCKVTPTSPPDELPEFPPQRAALYPGHDNFEVGGTGSGETYIPTKSSCYRGGMCWTDRGSVCSPRPSRDPDAFASSLRKYPASPDRSAEMVERLINYSQHHYTHPPRHYSPPCRACELASSSSARSSRRSREPDVCVRRQRSPEEYPTRERREFDADMYRKSTFCKNTDVRVVRDISKRIKESIKSMSNYVTAPSTVARDMFEEPPLEKLNVVNTEIQAAASMVSRKVCTVPQPVPIQRSVAIPLSPTSSQSGNDDTGNVSIDPSVTRSVQTIHRLGTSVHTSTSYTASKLIVTRKSKSFTNFGVDKELKKEILEWLDDASDPRLKRIQESVLKKLSNRLKRIPAIKIDRWKKDWECNDKVFKERIANEFHRMHAKCCYICKSADILRTETDNKNNYDNAVREWMNDISVKKRCLLRPVVKEQVYNTFVKTVKESAIDESASDRNQSLRAEILVLLDNVPIDYQGLSKEIYLNTLVDALITKLDQISEDMAEAKHVRNESQDQLIRLSSNYYSESIVKEKRLDPKKTVTQTKVVARDPLEIETELSDTLTLDLTNGDRSYKKKSLTDEVMALPNNVTKLAEDKSVEFAMQLQENLKGKLNIKRHVMESEPENVLTLQNTSSSRVNTSNAHTTKIEDNIREIVKIDLEYLDSSKYMSQLVDQIEEWLSNLQVAQEQCKDLRQAVVSDLANDIIDRQKYLELSNNKYSVIDELEHLKYQIFKWMNKLVGEDNTETIEHAVELMQRIKNIPVSAVNSQDQEIAQKCVGCRVGQNKVEYGYTKTTKSTSVDALNSWRDKQHIHRPINRLVQTIFTFSNSQFNLRESEVDESKKAASRCCLDAQSKANSGNDLKPVMSNLRPPCCQGVPPGAPSMKQINEEYEAYVSNWVKEIPIPSSTPSETALAEKARLGIENGIWKALTKLKFEPATFHNKFLYEDVLEEEIDELLDLLPQTLELQQKRHLLKVKLIEKTGQLNELLIAAAEPATYKQQLAEQVAINLPRRNVNTDAEDPNKLFEEMLILCIADDFILETRYKDEDKVRASAYRNKVIRKIETIIDEIKKTSGKEVKDFNSELCINNVLSALHKVPLPTEETLRQEADEILLGLEIEQWFNDLPIVENDDKGEQLHRRRLRDALTKKLHEMEKEVNIADCTGEPQYKHEISVFLEKLPLEKDQSLNINFMVDELTRRMKNREKAMNRRKSVAFQDGQQEYLVSQGPRNEQNWRPQTNFEKQDAGKGRFEQQPWSDSISPGRGYDTFSNQVPACSTMIRSDSIGQGIEFDSFSNQVPACSSMINPPPDPRSYNAPAGQYHEETLGGRFGYQQIPMSSQRYDQPGFQYFYPPHNINSMSNAQAGMPPQIYPGMSQNMNPVPTFYDRPDMASCKRYEPPVYEPSGEFVSLLHDSNPPPMQSFVPQFNNIQASHPCQNSCQHGASPVRPDQSAPQPPVASFAEDRFAHPDMTQAPTIYSQPDMPSFRRYSEPPPRIYEPSGEFVSLLHDSKPPQRFEQYQPPEQTGGFSFHTQASPARPDKPEPQPSVVEDQTAQQPNVYSQGRPNVGQADGSMRPETPGFNQSKREATQMVDHNRSANVPVQMTNQERSIPQNIQEPQNRSLPQTSHSNASNRDGPTFYNQDQRFLAPNLSTGMSISNQPMGFSTPNQRVSNAQPPNIKVRRQMEKKSRRVDSGTDDDVEEIRVRCECVERSNRRCKKRMYMGCDPCMEFPYYFPMGCPYPYFFNGL